MKGFHFAFLQRDSFVACLIERRFARTCVWGLVCGLVFLGSATVSFAQAPGWSRGQQNLAITYDDCLRRMQAALQAEGYRIDTAAGNFAVGIKNVHTAVIICGPAPDAKMLVQIVVASNGEGGGTERERLQAEMERPGQVPRPGSTGGGGNVGATGNLVGSWAIACCNDSILWTLSIQQQQDNTFSGVFSDSSGGGNVTNGQLRGNVIEFDRSGRWGKQHWSAQLVNDRGSLRMINGTWTGDFLESYPGRNNWHAEKQ